MKSFSKAGRVENDAAVEQILCEAQPRPVPSADEMLHVRRLVEDEWRKTASRRKLSRRYVGLGIAAALVAGVFITLSLLRVNGVSEVRVASIDQSYGSIYVLGENSELTTGSSLANVVAGQTLITGENSGIGLAWAGGGSLRIGADSRVEFRDRESIYLYTGQVYFDSGLPSETTRSSLAPAMTIHTDHGPVTHVGTQYMVIAADRSLTVNVREGTVRVGEGSEVSEAEAGDQLSKSGSSRATILDFGVYGDAWSWAERLAPRVDMKDRTIYEFLSWVSRELGLQLQFDSETTRQATQSETFRGGTVSDPGRALAFYMRGSGFGWVEDSGVIRIEGADHDAAR